ncbi:RecBCD enzyme subunit RecB [compost metagenome]
MLEQLQQQGFGEHWQPILLAWMQVLLNTPLNDTGVALSALAPQHKQAELQFYLPIEQLLQARELDTASGQWHFCLPSAGAIGGRHGFVIQR